MGIADGSTLIASSFSLSRNMTSVSDINSKLFFGPNATREFSYSSKYENESSRIQHGTTAPMRPHQIYTTVKGKVLTIPTLPCSTLPGVVDLRVEKPIDIDKEQSGDRQNVEKISRKLSDSSCSDDERQTKTLKFGIDSILKSEDKLQSNRNSLSSKDTMASDCDSSVEDEHVQENFIQMQKNDKEQWQSFSKDENKQETTRSRIEQSSKSEKLIQNAFRSSKVCSPTRSEMTLVTTDARFHPYPKIAFERSHSDPTSSQINKITIDNHKERIGSELESQRRTTNLHHVSHQPAYSPFCDFETAKSRVSSSDSDITRPGSSQEPLPFCPTKKSKEPGKHPLKMVKTSDLARFRPLDNDDVFKDETDLTRCNMTAYKNFQKLLQQRGTCSLPTPPEFLSTFEKQKYGAMGYFPPHQPLAAMSSTSPTNFNFTPWSSFSPNCHPVFRHFFNPLTLYNQSTAAAVAYMNSFKSMPYQPLLSPTSPHLSTSPTSGHFNFRGNENEHFNYDEKDGGTRKKKRWSRAVFSPLQRQSLEESFKRQKYVAKPERRFLAETLGLTDAQVKIWFQNRRMKWRQEQRSRRGADTNEMLANGREDNFCQVQVKACCSV